MIQLRLPPRYGVCGLLALMCVPVLAAGAPAALDTAQVDALAREWLADTQAPSVSIAIVRDGQLQYAQAYGFARLAPPQAASAQTRYAIDSVSKEFTAAAILLLVEQGKLALDDKVERFFPQLGAASQASVRELLTHTSGLRDYWPQDYVPQEMLRPVSTPALLQEWAARGLDFEPGTQLQYSNTGYALAGAIVEQLAGQPLLEFEREHIFAPLHMQHVTSYDAGPLPSGDALAYTRYGLGAVRAADKEAAGWLFGSALLAMAPQELALWDISLINQSLLSADSYRAQQQRVVLKNGATRDYGLGLDVETVEGQARIGHDGGGSGTLSANRIWPQAHAALIVITNNDWASPDDLLDRLAFALLTPSAAQARASALFADFQRGSVQRALFTDNGNAYLSDAVLADMKRGLGPLGPARLITLERESRRGGMVTRDWKILCRRQRLQVIERAYPDGKIEQFMVSLRED